MKIQAGVAQFAHKDNFQRKENVAIAIQIAKTAMVQVDLTALTVQKARRSSISLVLMSALIRRILLTKTVFTNVGPAIQSVILVMAPPWIAVSCARIHSTLSVKCASCSVHQIIPSMKAQEFVIHVETSVKHQPEIRTVPFITQMIKLWNLYLRTLKRVACPQSLSLQCQCQSSFSLLCLEFSSFDPRRSWDTWSLMQIHLAKLMRRKNAAFLL